MGLVFQQLDDAAADDGGIGNLGHSVGRLRIADAESYANWQIHVLLDAGHHGCHIFDVQGIGARHALERNVVDIAAGNACHLLNALVRAGGRQQKIWSMPCARSLAAKLSLSSGG